MAGEFDINLSDGTVLATLHALEVNGPDNRSTPRLIQGVRPSHQIVQVNTTNDYFIVSGDVTDYFPGNLSFEVSDSTGNDGSYTVDSGGSTYDSSEDQTNIPVTSSISDSTADGDIIINAFVLSADLTYRFVDQFEFDVQDSGGGTNDGTYTVSSIGSFVVQQNISDKTVIPVTSTIPSTSLPYGQIRYTVQDDRSSLKLPGKGTINYGEALVENLVRITENFASPDSPDSNNTITGGGPAAQPLTGQLWYDTSNDTTNRYDGSQWTHSVNADDEFVLLKDVEDNDKTIYLTAAETNLPSPWPGGSDNQPGAVLWPDADPNNNEPLFRILSSDGTEHLRIEYNSDTDSSYTRTVGNVDIQGTGESYVYGQLGIGDNGVPTVDQTLTVEGNGVAINAPENTDSNVTLDSPVGQKSTVIFETQNTERGQIIVDDSVTDHPLQINPTSGASVQLVEGGGSVQSFGRVGINNTPPTGDTWLEVTGDVKTNNQIIASSEDKNTPSYSFIDEPDSGIFLSSTGVIGFSVNETELFQLRDDSGTARFAQSDYELQVTDPNDVPNKQYVDKKIQSISWREPVRVRDQQSRTDSADFPTSGTIDGVSLNDGDRVLFTIVQQVEDRDIWQWDQSSTSWIRVEQVTPFKQQRTVGDVVYVEQGTDRGTVWAWNANDSWELVISRSQSGVTTIFETQTADSDQQEVFTLSNEYLQGGNNLIVFVNGQKVTLDEFYQETGAKEITIISPSPIISGDRLDFYIIEPTTTRATNFQRETRSSLSGTPTINFNNVSYVVGSENLLVYINGQKAIRTQNYNEVSSTSIEWLSPTLTTSDTIEVYSSVPVVAGKRLQDIADVQSTPEPDDGQYLRYDSSTGTWLYKDGTSDLVIEQDGSVVTNKVKLLNFINLVTLTDQGSDEVDVQINATGTDSNVVTGTAGTTGNLIEWNTDGDAVDSSVATDDVITVSDSIDRLDDVDTSSTSPSTDDVLKFDGTNWIPQADTDTTTGVSDNGTEVVSGVSDINFSNLLDVTDDTDGTVTVDVSGDVLTVNSSIDDLDDVDTSSTSPSTDDVLKWDGTNWVPQSDTDTTTGVSDDGTEVVASVSDINFNTRLDVTDDGDGTVTIDVPITGADSNVVTGTAGTDGNLVYWNADGDAVDSSISSSDILTVTSSIDNLDDVDTSTSSPSTDDVLKWDGSNWVPQSDTDTTTGVSDDGTEVVSGVSDINFGTNLTVTDDTDGTVTVDASGGSAVSIEDNGTETIAESSGINFSNLLDVTDDGDDTVTVDVSGDVLTVTSSIDDLNDVDTTSTAPSDGDVLTWDDTNSVWIPSTSSSGGVSSSTSTSTDNALVRYDGTSGDTVQQTGITVDDDDNIKGHGQSISFETADFTLAEDQAGQVLDCDKSSAFTVTVPSNSNVALPVGYTVSLVQSGSGTVTVSGESGVTIQTINTTDLNGQWAAATLYKRQTDEWVLMGDLA